jgi:hypothetical protein
MLAALIALLGLSAPLPAQAGVYNGYQTPDYTVLRRDGAVEMRDCAPYLAAEVTVTGSRRQALGKGFRVLAGYIFGGNSQTFGLAMTAPVTQGPGARIAMTGPVTQTAGQGAWIVRFMMPPAYSAATLPVPDSAAVRIVKITPGKRLVLTFSGLANAASLKLHEAALRAAAANQGLTPTEPVEIAYFDDPFTLPWKRRNQVSVPVD